MIEMIKTGLATGLGLLLVGSLLLIGSPAADAQTGLPVTESPGSLQLPPAAGLKSEQPSTNTQAAPLSETRALSQPTVLPHELTPWGMFLAADVVVKAVMVGLALASFLVWTVWLAKTVELISAKRALRRSRVILGAQPAIADARQSVASGSLAAAFIECACAEIALSGDTSDPAGIEKRVASRIADLEAAAVRSIRSGTGLLATVGATAPFVGLFGTVWGIMNSFIGISRAHTTNLAVVAPGIAEALLATAIGLVAAIPAVILYNQLARATAGYRALVRENAGEVLRILSRDLEHSVRPSERLKAAE